MHCTYFLRTYNIGTNCRTFWAARVVKRTRSHSQDIYRLIYLYQNSICFISINILTSWLRVKHTQMQKKKQIQTETDRHRHKQICCEGNPPSTKKKECNWGSGHISYGKVTCVMHGNRKENEAIENYK